MGEDSDKAHWDYEKFRQRWIDAMSEGSLGVRGDDFTLSPQKPSYRCFICGHLVYSDEAINDAKLLERYTGQPSGVLCCNCFKVAKVIIDGKEREVVV